MQPSITQTLAVEIAGSQNTARLIQAGHTAMRVLVRNTGGNLIFIAHDPSAIQDINSLGSCYQLPAGAADVFVLSPKQSLYAGGSGGGGQVSIAASEAFPTKQWMES